jgi:drug/metabolite transporter (DMT)-like permease
LHHWKGSLAAPQWQIWPGIDQPVLWAHVPVAKDVALPLPDPAKPPPSATAMGITCGAGAAVCWAMGFAAARHGITIGLTPLDIAMHRFVWAGIVLFPLMARDGFADLGGVGWGRGIALTMFGGLPLAVLSYSGFLLVPLGHGGVIQPSCGALGGLALASLVLREKLPLRRLLGAGVICCGLAVIGAEALRTIGTHGLIGDLMFVGAGFSFATFGTLLRLWRVAPMRAAAVTSVVSLVCVPIEALTSGFSGLLAAGWNENLLQALVQGAGAGAGATYLFTRSVVLLGAGRAAVLPSLVPGITLLIGYLALGEVPSASQLVGFVIVLVGFQLTQRG